MRDETLGYEPPPPAAAAGDEEKELAAGSQRAEPCDAADAPPPKPPGRGVVPSPLSSSLVAPPFTLRSCGVTVWELGSVQRAAFAHRYWSSKGCTFHHAYPVGFRASKTQFGKEWTASVCSGVAGPSFRVADASGRVAFEGPTPTAPWTALCVAMKRGTRISGPLFYGFSDPLTQRAIAQLYTPEELAAAKEFSTVATVSPGAAEAAAEEMRRGVEGLGEATAIALAHTSAFGAPITGMDALRAIVGADGGAAKLEAWLKSSSEVPAATRRWPLWCAVFVPKIMAFLAGGEEGQGGEGDDAGVAVDGKRKKGGKENGGNEGGDGGGGGAGEGAATERRSRRPRKARAADD